MVLYIRHLMDIFLWQQARHLLHCPSTPAHARQRPPSSSPSASPRSVMEPHAIPQATAPLLHAPRSVMEPHATPQATAPLLHAPRSVMEPHAAPQATAPLLHAPRDPLSVRRAWLRPGHCRFPRCCRRSLGSPAPCCPVTGPCPRRDGPGLAAFSAGPDKLKTGSGNRPSISSLGLDLSDHTLRPSPQRMVGL